MIEVAWKEYDRDYGLGRIIIFITVFQTYLFLLSGLYFNHLQPMALAPVTIGLVLLAAREALISRGPSYLLSALIIAVSSISLINYVLVGQIDEAVGWMPRVDRSLMQFDQDLFGMPIAVWLQEHIFPTGVWGKWLNDFLMCNYIIYFTIPYMGGLIYFNTLREDQYKLIGRYLASFMLYFNFNYYLYIVVPVTGPQYFISEQFTKDIPFTAIGQYFFDRVYRYQGTFIDCFPSGHSGISLLAAMWMFRTKNPARYAFLVIWLSITLATQAMRFHYLVDIIASVPLAFICYYVAKKFIPVGVKVAGKVE